MRQLRRRKRLWRRSLTRSHKRTSLGPSRSCWNGALQPEEITWKGTRVSCVYYQEKCPYEKSLETYLMILVCIKISCETLFVYSRKSKVFPNFSNMRARLSSSGSFCWSGVGDQLHWTLEIPCSPDTLCELLTGFASTSLSTASGSTLLLRLWKWSTTLDEMPILPDNITELAFMFKSTALESMILDLHDPAWSSGFL